MDGNLYGGGGDRNSRFELFRYILPLEARRLGFVGYASSGNCSFTSEVQPHWLSECFQGKLEPPIPAEMREEIAEVARWTSGSAQLLRGRVRQIQK